MDKSIARQVEDKIDAAVADFEMPLDHGVLVGYSGGPDSSALLHYLCKRGVRVTAAHLNHGIRGAEANRDETFCRHNCAALGVDFVAGRADVPAIAKASGRTVEEAARVERYAFFRRVIDEMPEGDRPEVIATAHNADDNAETVIFNLLRGSGTRGLAGIPPVRGKRHRIIRPLIYTTKSELLAYCVAEGVEYVTDSTNADTDYTRNYIRAEIVPRLYRINPSPEEAISRLCSIMRDDDACLRGLARDFCAEYATGSSAPREALARLHPAVRSRVLMTLYREACGEGRGSLGYEHVRSVMALLSEGETGSRLDLPGRIRFVMTKTDASFLTEEEYNRLTGEKGPFEHPLSIGLSRFDNFDIELRMGDGVETDGKSPENPDGTEKIKRTNEIIYKKSIKANLAFDRIRGNLFARSRRPGDRYALCGVNRKVKKLLGEYGVPVWERDALPFLCDDDGIIWIPGFPVRDGMSPAEGERTLEATVYLR